MIVDVIVPQIGEAVSELTIVRWLKKKGEYVKQGEPLFEVDSEKAIVEVESLVSGVLVEILVGEGEAVMPLDKVARIETEEVKERLPEEQPQLSSPGARVEFGELENFSTLISTGEIQGTRDQGVESAEVTRIQATPKARSLAKEYGIGIENIRGTGSGGLITAEDVERHYQLSKVTKGRQVIARKMQKSKQEVPHFYLTVSVDMSQIQSLRDYCKRILLWDKTPSFTAIVCRACALGVKLFPKVNRYYADGQVVERNSIDIGIAVGDEDSLLVPVVRNADRLGLRALSDQIELLTNKARSGSLRLDDLDGKTMVVSNLGMYAIDSFLAIIDMPDPMILAMGAIKDQASVVDKTVVVRPICCLTLSVDHRVVDGVLAAKFLSIVKENLEMPFALLGNEV